jgi:hypothetical protein
MGEERRRHSRLKPDKGYIVTCYSAEAGDPSAAKYNLASKLVDVSPRGACLVTVGRLRARLPVQVEVYFPKTGARVRMRATVRWSQTVESRGPNKQTAHVAGLEFDKTLQLQNPRKEAPRPGRTEEPRRGSKRFSPGDVQLVCLPRNFWRALGLSSNAARQVKDLSLGGVQIVSTRRLKPGQGVSLRLEFRKPHAVIEAEGEVRWCRRDTLSLEPRWNAGVAFRRLPPVSHSNLVTIEKIFLGF